MVPLTKSSYIYIDTCVFWFCFTYWLCLMMTGSCWSYSVLSSSSHEASDSLAWFRQWKMNYSLLKCETASFFLFCKWVLVRWLIYVIKGDCLTTCNSEINIDGLPCLIALKCWNQHFPLPFGSVVSRFPICINSQCRVWLSWYILPQPIFLGNWKVPMYKQAM